MNDVIFKLGYNEIKIGTKKLICMVDCKNKYNIILRHVTSLVTEEFKAPI